MTNQDYMKRALELAKKAMGYTSPNPMVGCVVVKDGRIVTEGYHERCGEYHAERNALTKCSEDLTGATMYVTLEPCCHQGKTPPCTDIILERGIGKVYVGSMDPNPKVAGKGVQMLREAGVTVVEDFMREECDQLNPVFFHYITTKTPYVVMKYAMTLDGKIATKTGASKWITGESARKEVQHMRHQYMGIMAGIGTVLADDPMLNVRVEGWKSPVRIVCDSKLRIPPGSQIVKSAEKYRTIVAYAEQQIYLDAYNFSGSVCVGLCLLLTVGSILRSESFYPYSILVFAAIASSFLYRFVRLRKVSFLGWGLAALVLALVSGVLYLTGWGEAWRN